MVSVADDAERVLLSPSASSLELTGISRNFFRVFFSDFDEGTTMGMFAVNKVTSAKIDMPAEEMFDQPASVMGVVYNLLFDYSGQMRDPVKVDSLIDYVLRLK